MIDSIGFFYECMKMMLSNTQNRNGLMMLMSIFVFEIPETTENASVHILMNQKRDIHMTRRCMSAS